MLPLDDEDYLGSEQDEGLYNYPTASRNDERNNNDYFFFLDTENEANAVSTLIIPTVIILIHVFGS